MSERGVDNNVKKIKGDEMSKIVEHFLIPLFVVVSVLYAFNSFGNNDIEMIKVYHHTADEAMHLERANLSFYFSRDPHIQEIKNKKSDGTSCTFFFPHAVIKHGECEAMIKRVNDYNNGYTITIAPVVKPALGIQLTFTIDTTKFAVSYELFDSIGLHKGLVFRLHDKGVLQRLERAHNQPVLRTLWHTGKPRIAIDPGHGGVDSGAIGCGGIQEKNVCLALGQAVRTLLESQGCDVLLTRNSDHTVFLDDRTTCANNGHADLFVSIHANYSVNPNSSGIETFCVRPQLFKQGVTHLSAAENRYVSHASQERADYADKLAQSVQRNVCEAVVPYHEVIDRHVKYSVSQVLLGAQMPSILVEVGFVSNSKEAALLSEHAYQKSIARGICNGILAAIAS